MVFLIWNGSEFSCICSNSEELIIKAHEVSKLDVERIRIYYEIEGKRIYLARNTVLSSLKTNSFYVKDIGPQFNYRAVFILEYIGPLLIWPIVYRFSAIRLDLASILWISHYLKRLFESIFVHSFSNTTMPYRNLIKNCLYYWSMAFLISYSYSHSIFSFEVSDLLKKTFFALFFIFESLNAYCHIALKNLRPKNSKDHILPRGIFFNSITSPNYTFEILSWISFSFYIHNYSSFLFTVLGAIQMYKWASQKRIKLSFKYPEAKNRGRLTPFLLF